MDRQRKEREAKWKLVQNIPFFLLNARFMLENAPSRLRFPGMCHLYLAGWEHIWKFTLWSLRSRTTCFKNKILWICLKVKPPRVWYCTKCTGFTRNNTFEKKVFTKLFWGDKQEVLQQVGEITVKAINIMGKYAIHSSNIWTCICGGWLDAAWFQKLD